ncbi:unnamed protein product [Rotaria magnacalcarata]|uniref:Major facilitator superfamily (MFS) profile domain-containing protein n=3 Tax=Rotaria magnacalcarata TaxID=392030 RepID=A0A816PPK1_9BILA|nr:unnamed protein product [Rotaria magnacalcarata]
MTLSNIQQRIPNRYVLGLLRFFGLFNAFILRANLSIAIVAMVTPMNETTSNNIMPAGFLATIYGGRILFGGSIGLCAFLTLFTPLCAQAGSEALIFLRLLEGLVSTCAYPALHDIWSKWGPKRAYLGTFIILMFGGVIAADWSWEWAFYLSGLFCLVWTAIRFYFTAELPSTHETISEEEAKYIEENRDQAISQIDTIPWKDIFTSLPVWAIIAVHFGTSWSLFLIFNEFPTFLVKSLGFRVDSAGSMAALLWLLLAVTVYAAGIISDKLTEKYSTLFLKREGDTRFVISMVIGVLALAFYIVFAGGELQTWAWGSSNEYEPVLNNPISSPNANESSVLDENNTEWIRRFVSAYTSGQSTAQIMALANIYQRIPKRYIFSVLAFFGMFNASMLRSNLSIAVVEIITPRVEITSNNTTRIIPAVHNWSTTTQGYILSSFFFTYTAVQVPLGFLATRFGGRIFFGGSIGLCAFVSLFTPLCVRSGSTALILLRLLEGFCLSSVYPSLHVVWSIWAPKTDKSKMASLAFSGVYCGAFFIMLTGGAIAADWSWEWVFYLPGLSALSWTIAWFYVTAESPSTHPTISVEEVKYIEDNMDKDILRTDTIPWKAVLTSLPVWAIIAAHFGANWSAYLILTELPTFLVKALDFRIDTAGLLAALPWLALGISTCAAGVISDRLTEKYSTLYIRKLIMFITFTIMVLSFLMIILLNVKSRGLIVMGITIMATSCGPAWANFGVNHLDIGGHYAGVLMSISNSIGSTPGFLAPMITGYIVENPHLKREWNIIFIISIVICVLAIGFYMIFAAGELQPWALNNNNEYEPVLNNPISSQDLNENNTE